MPANALGDLLGQVLFFLGFFFFFCPFAHGEAGSTLENANPSSSVEKQQYCHSRATPGQAGAETAGYE